MTITENSLLERVRALETRVAYERGALREARLASQQHLTHVAELSARIIMLESECADLRHELGHIYAGRSWRITRPLRWMARLARHSGEFGDNEHAQVRLGAVDALGCKVDSERTAELLTLVGERDSSVKHSPK
jgi:hypothetical protein